MDSNWYKRPFENCLTGKKNLVGVEIGVYLGRHALEMLRLLDIKTLFLIDYWKDYNACHDIKNLVGKARDGAENLLSGYKEKTVFYQELSSEAVKIFKNKSLDFIYIDGNHDYEYVKSDIELWWPKLKDDGLLGGHDYTVFKSVRQAVDEMKKTLNVDLKTSREDWWFKR